MPSIRFSFEHANFDARIDAVLPDTEDALERALGPVASDMADAARNAALAHIRFEGTKPGQYLASIYGGTFRGPGVVGGFVRSGSPLAHLLELGASTPAHDILPKAAAALAFDGSAGQVFASIVHHPGATIPAYPALSPAFDAARGAIAAAIESAAKG
ncbi:hypothetical protein DFR50_14258 [Roseiarcus fermentans]|uniref:HK97 gp10 family phage protein n=1 Tax=Roseiarcus fermentans TaxID=1473586 RepID=A0A366EQ42_9HYPH|nr:hypothetical protein [Roseiarcus fermentans]RBP03810.1 hypothetical protein DFR50_14258 [Roseiarcus fermentans]